MQPPASLEVLGDPIYEAFYGLNDQPFAITTDPKFFFFSAAHEHGYNELLAGLRRYEGILLVTGQTGTGKTTLCRAVIDALGDRTFAAIVLNPYMSGPEIYRVLLRDFGMVSNEDLRRGALATADLPQLLDTVEGFLRSLVPFGGHAVIVLDEAQSLQTEVLDQLRLLTALEHRNRRLVQIILCGQPSLLDTLKTAPMHALNERITRRVMLAPLPASEVPGYIAHRLSVAGGQTVQFDPAAARVVSDLARGLPRRVNVLCDRALQEGRIEGVDVITADLVKRAARSLTGLNDPPAAAAFEAARDSAAAAPMFGSFALGSGESADRQPSRMRRAVVVIFGVAVLLAASAYGLIVYRASADMPDLPSVTAPARDRGPILLALPPPAADELLLIETAPPLQRPLSQLPGDSHELN